MSKDFRVFSVDGEEFEGGFYDEAAAHTFAQGKARQDRGKSYLVLHKLAEYRFPDPGQREVGD